ncbi:MarR family winged helix-turn-helix transcriptional regulator [Rhodococcus sp. NPDC059968]|uniref:MarR family winged helix-turn-helix transcriptional regulator n=1 Tax=Rhodococcus sp. NPDC059968 TaxID=3347017 RepID=UPI00366EB910
MPKRNELTEEQRQAWRVYIEGSLRLETRLDEALRASTGLSMIDYHVLLLLSEAPGQRLRMREIAAKMVFSRSRITYQITSMRKRGLVAREPAPDDGRGSRAVLTAVGLQALRDAAPPHAQAARDLFLDDLDAEELRCIRRVFTRLSARLY